MRSGRASTNRPDAQRVPVRRSSPLPAKPPARRGSAQVLHVLPSGRLSSGVMELFREGWVGSKLGHGLGHVEFVPRCKRQSLCALRAVWDLAYGTRTHRRR